MRSISVELDDISLGINQERDPAWQILIYDLRSTSDTIREIIDLSVLDPLTGPWDITEYVTTATISETASDYATTGVATSSVSISLVDPDGQFNPMDVITDSAALGRFFRSGNVIRILEGDARVNQAFWPLTFTGVLSGQAAYNRSRATQESDLRLQAFGREGSFLNFVRTTDEFTIGQTYRAVALNVVEQEMGLDLISEVDFSLFGTQTVRHSSVQMVDEDPITMLAKVMFIDGLMPRFNGAGVLIDAPDAISNASNRFYTDQRNYLSIARPLSNVEAPTSVCVLGLDAELSRVEQPMQLVAETSVTTGYFTDGELVPVFWSEDQTQLIRDPVMVVVKSVGLDGLGGGEHVAYLSAPNVPAEGTIGAIVRIDTGYAANLAIMITINYVALAAIPDAVVSFIGGVTEPIGRVIQAGMLAGLMVLMSKIGRGQYEFFGFPFEFVFKEIRACARVDGVGEFDLNEIELKNHWIVTQADADSAARTVLFKQQALKHPRTINMFFDYALEVNDVFEDFDTRRRFTIQTIDRTLIREADQQLATYGCAEITDNISLSA